LLLHTAELSDEVLNPVRQQPTTPLIGDKNSLSHQEYKTAIPLRSVWECPEVAGAVTLAENSVKPGEDHRRLREMDASAPSRHPLSSLPS
jgi:hypothetical protein